MITELSFYPTPASSHSAKILYLVERLRVGERSSRMRMASLVMPMMRRTALSSMPIS